MFGRNPFFNSFFSNQLTGRDPFQQMDNMMRSFFEDPFLGNQPNLEDRFLQAPGHQGRRIDVHGQPPPQAPFLPSGQWGQQFQQAAASGPHIAELDDASSHRTHQLGFSQPDLVEEPLDKPLHNTMNIAEQQEVQHQGGIHRDYGAPGRGRQLMPFAGMPLGSLMGGSSTSFHSVTVRTGGPGGVHYERTQTTHVGPGGVVESKERVHDSRRGHQSFSHTRKLGDKGHTAHRLRDASGREQVQEVLHNLEDHEKHDFHKMWTERSQHGARPATSQQGWPARPTKQLIGTEPHGPIIEEYHSEDEDVAEEQPVREGDCCETTATAAPGLLGGGAWMGEAAQQHYLPHNPQRGAVNLQARQGVSSRPRVTTAAGEKRKRAAGSESRTASVVLEGAAPGSDHRWYEDQHGVVHIDDGDDESGYAADCNSDREKL